jgi:hypothetical protein
MSKQGRATAADVIQWFDNLPYEAKLYWTGRDHVDYNNLPFRRYAEYMDKLSRNYLSYSDAKAFNSALSWDEYVKTPDYELWVFHMRDSIHRSYEQDDDRRQEEISRGVARSPTMVFDGVMKN